MEEQKGKKQGHEIDGILLRHDNYFSFRKIKVEEITQLKNLSKWVDETEIRNDIDHRKKDIYVALKNQNVIGEFTVYYDKENSQETIPGKRVYLSAFRVLPNYRNKGIGKKLNEFVLSDLERIGYTEFTLGVEDDNYNAKHIYEQSGFIEVIDRCSETIDQRTYEYNLLLRRKK